MSGNLRSHVGVVEMGTGIRNGPETYQYEFVGIMGHNMSLPQDFQDSWNFSSTLKLRCHQTLTLSLVSPPLSLPPNFWVFQTSKPGTHQSLTLFPFIVIFAHLLFLPHTAFLCFYYCMLCFAMFPFALPLPLTSHPLHPHYP